MAYGIVHVFPGGTKDQYDASTAGVHPRAAPPPPGHISPAGAPGAEGWAITAVHDSKASWDTFRDGTLMPRMQEGIPGGFASPPNETAFEVDTLVS